MKLTKLLEIGAEGGAISLCKVNDKEKIAYFYTVDEMDYNLEDFSAIQTGSTAFSTFMAAYNALLKKYPFIYRLYPLYIHSEIKTFILSEFKVANNDGTKNYSYSYWLEKLM
ncbi:hypothetical protein [uncultured Maribacter sp.]|uniref:hypothetical protein n=1 Tax=uncultured Maribacter sp. TaxID=431308 RepID=UPI002601A9F8|nr:hypothetical protein [uncultured Maribacter sp.]